MKEFAKIQYTTNGGQVLVVRAYEDGQPVLKVYTSFDDGEIMTSTCECESEARRDQMFDNLSQADVDRYSDMLYECYLEQSPELGGRSGE